MCVCEREGGGGIEFLNVVQAGYYTVTLSKVLYSKSCVGGTKPDVCTQSSDRSHYNAHDKPFF